MKKIDEVPAKGDAMADLPTSDPIADMEETLFLDCVTLISAEARAQMGPPSAWDSKVLDQPPDHRIGRRRRINRRVGVAVRGGSLGLGPDLGGGLVDASEDGLGLRLKGAVMAGQEITIELSLPGVSKPFRVVAEVRWCRPDAAGMFLAGVRLRRRLPYAALTDLTR